MKQEDLVLSTLKYSWHEINGKPHLIAYHLPDGEICHCIMEYIYYLSMQCDLNARTIKNEALYLKKFIEFLPESDLLLVNDVLLKQFRDHELALTRNRKNSSGDLLRAQRSVNIGLRRIYKFLTWSSQNGWLPAHYIGEYDSKITVLERDRNRRRSQSQQTFPLLFKRSGSAGTTNGRYFATDEDKSQMEKYFRENCTEFTYARNILFMEIANAVGWRRGAINSLLCAQFESISINDKVLKIRPASQKFGYQYTFDVGVNLAAKIRFFIHNFRKAYFLEMGWDDACANDRIFTSARDGLPLTDQAISQIFGAAFKAIGAPRGAGLHSFRRKFTDERVESEIRGRLRLGLDTSVASVAASVAILLGHSNPESVNAYVERAHARLLERGVDSSDL
ncbi:hypothetical protein [Herbaspirillum sp. YR522]|uniref:hypothetical protein n=1 Tax=Herbaspirillum sp. YR522 TaxID=1144342 RepID=UPI00026F6D55|nr:hypothetical protein [Herbaspirillum sp. YR522]EJN10131.1 hypothetical protein PMI40_00218 [Herbaspirillum sp. YR522]